MALPRAAASRVDSWFGSDAVDKRTTTFAGTPRPTLSALPRKRRYPNRLHALLRLLRDAADLSLSIPMRTPGIDYIGVKVVSPHPQGLQGSHLNLS